MQEKKSYSFRPVLLNNKARNLSSLCKKSKNIFSSFSFFQRSLCLSLHEWEGPKKNDKEIIIQKRFVSVQKGGNVYIRKKKKTCSEETVAKKKKHFFSFKEDPTAGGVARGWDLTLFFLKIKKRGVSPFQHAN